MPSTTLLKTIASVAFRTSTVCCLRNVSSHLSFTKVKNVPITSQIAYHLNHRMMSSAVVAITNIDYNELKNYQKNPVATIIDVREVDEIKETGSIPGAINIPLGELGKALEQDPKSFEVKYHHAKPLKDSPVIFSCRSGKRSMMGAQTAEKQGYLDVKNYAGGWLDWESHLPK